MKKAMSSLKKKVENLESKCKDVDFLMAQTNHLLKDYEGFNKDVDETYKRLNIIDDKIKNQDDRITDLTKWKSKQMAKEWNKPKEFIPFQGGIVLVKDKILHLQKLLLFTNFNDHKQHL